LIPSPFHAVEGELIKLVAYQILRIVIFYF